MALNPSLKYMPKYSGSEYELKVSRIKMDDKGEYIVRAVNSFGSKEESAVLSVERKLCTSFDHRSLHSSDGSIYRFPRHNIDRDDCRCSETVSCR